jgi:plasmid replication initiation protein
MTRRLPPKGDYQPDLFAANFADIPIRDQRDTMERPFFSLAKKPRFAPIEYNVGDVWVEVSANPKFGIATIWDADILIWASTQVTEALDRGLTPSRTIHFYPHNLLKSIRRPTGGEHYMRLRAALERLTHTAVRTNIRAQGNKKAASFHWLESWTEVTDVGIGPGGYHFFGDTGARPKCVRFGQVAPTGGGLEAGWTGLKLEGRSRSGGLEDQ